MSSSNDPRFSTTDHVLGVGSDIGTGITMNNLLRNNGIAAASRFQSLPQTGSTVAGIGLTGGSRNDWVFRVDNPHRGAEYPHINVNRNMTGRPDPHTPISTFSLKIAGKIPNICSKINQVAPIVTIAVDVIRVGKAIYEDGGFGKKSLITSASIAGSSGGGVAGSFGGAQTGAYIGTIFGPVGTAVGALTGGAIGGIFGAIGGDYGASFIARKIISKYSIESCEECDRIEKKCRNCEKREKRIREWSGEDTFCCFVNIPIKNTCTRFVLVNYISPYNTDN